MSKRLTRDEYRRSVANPRNYAERAARWHRIDLALAALDGIPDADLERLAAIKDPANRLRTLAAVATAHGTGLDLQRLA